jgi:hypothetical protein
MFFKRCNHRRILNKILPEYILYEGYIDDIVPDWQKIIFKCEKCNKVESKRIYNHIQHEQHSWIS